MRYGRYRNEITIVYVLDAIILNRRLDDYRAEYIWIHFVRLMDEIFIKGDKA